LNFNKIGKGEKMSREIVFPAQLRRRLCQLNELMEKCASLLAEIEAMDHGEADFDKNYKINELLDFNLAVILQTISLADCKLITDSEKALENFEEILKAGFEALLSMQETLVSLPEVSEQYLKNLAVTVVRARELHDLGKKEEYVNNLIVSLVTRENKTIR
jgi:hypothetical protein